MFTNLYELFKETVRKYPESIFVVSNGQEYSYKQIKEEADCVASTLFKMGIRKNENIGIYMQKNKNVIVAILAILKLGACYVPLDPKAPINRLQLILEKANLISCIVDDITQRITNIKEININSILNKNYKEIIDNKNYDSDNNAYIIFTSGSTGTPKGVQISHRNVLRLLKVTNRLFEFKSSDVWTMFHSYAFDFSVWELWMPIFHGSKVVILNEETRDNQKLIEVLKREKVTVYNQTPQAFKNFIDENVDFNYENFRYVIFGGDKLNIKDLNELRLKNDSAKEVKFINMYGITEITVHASFFEINNFDLDESIIGLPLDDLHFYVCDESGNEVEEGEKGELYITGGGVAKGYYNDSFYTIENFIPNKFDEMGKYAYKTSDIVYRKADGNYVYVDRCDNQIQLRGYRVELGEIEYGMMNVAGIQKCCILIEKVKEEHKVLVAFYSGKKLDSKGIRQQLHQYLPEYMIPNKFIYVENMPLNHNGKIDKKRLKEINVKRHIQSDEKVYNNEVKDIICDILGITELGIKESVIELGADSLIITRIINKILQKQKVKIPFTYFYQNPNVEKLSEYVENSKRSNENGNVQIVKQNIPLSYAQESLFFLDATLPKKYVYNISWMWTIEGKLSIEKLEQALES